MVRFTLPEDSPVRAHLISCCPRTACRCSCWTSADDPRFGLPGRGHPGQPVLAAMGVSDEDSAALRLPLG